MCFSKVFNFVKDVAKGVVEEYTEPESKRELKLLEEKAVELLRKRKEEEAEEYKLNEYLKSKYGNEWKEVRMAMRVVESTSHSDIRAKNSDNVVKVYHSKKE